MEKDPIADYVVLAEWIWLKRELEPDWDSAQEIERLYALLKDQKPDSSEKLELARWNMVPLCVQLIYPNAAEGRDRVADALRLCREFGCAELEVSALSYQGGLYNPDLYSDGDG
jgi:hypothetical protein